MLIFVVFMCVSGIVSLFLLNAYIARLRASYRQFKALRSEEKKPTREAMRQIMQDGSMPRWVILFFEGLLYLALAPLPLLVTPAYVLIAVLGESGIEKLPSSVITMSNFCVMASQAYIPYALFIMVVSLSFCLFRERK